MEHLDFIIAMSVVLVFALGFCEWKEIKLAVKGTLIYLVAISVMIFCFMKGLYLLGVLWVLFVLWCL